MAEECSIVVDAIENRTRPLTDEDIQFLGRFESVENYINNGKCGPKINRTPKMMLQNENCNKYFKPREMSIGPLNHYEYRHRIDNSIKFKLGAGFFKLSGKTGENLLQEIKNNIDDLKKLFPEDLDFFYDDDLARVLFLDGCAVLQFIFSYMHQELKNFNINNGQADIICHDLFILENQIPFRVLKLLLNSMSAVNVASQFRILIFTFVLEYNITEQDRFEAFFQLYNLASFCDKHEPVHLLGILHSVFVYGEGLNEHLIPSNEILAGNGPAARQINKSSYERSFRNVQELKEAGIEVTPSDLKGLNSVNFATKFFVTGQLKFPPLIVDNSTEQKLLNLVAYEMNRDDYESNCWVVSYVNLLDLLIDSEQDVKDLRATRVLRNRLSNDAEVAQLFNRLGSSCSAPPRDQYLPLKNKLQSHYERKLAVWVAQVYHDQFRSPWTVLALIAALIALLLTGIQTWYAVNPKN